VVAGTHSVLFGADCGIDGISSWRKPDVVGDKYDVDVAVCILIVWRMAARGGGSRGSNRGRPGAVAGNGLWRGCQRRQSGGGIAADLGKRIGGAPWRLSVAAATAAAGGKRD